MIKGSNPVTWKKCLEDVQKNINYYPGKYNKQTDYYSTFIISTSLGLIGFK